MKPENLNDQQAGQTDGLGKWPLGGLERVTRCPACDSGDREILYSGLTDRVFFCAPGEWTLHRCQSCGCGYLDPRPTPETIHLAYSYYYTHENASSTDENPTRLGLIRRALGNGYRNWRFGTTFEPENRLGALLFLLWPSVRKRLDMGLRHLPKRPTHGRLLDVGFGAGTFLERAKKGGWDVVGADPDPVVVEAARSRGLDVRQGGIQAFSDEAGSFDAITLSHVIEHVFSPQHDLEEAFKLLKPGGALWIQTPNIRGPVHQYFGRNWRGLEPPRHLTIFNSKALFQCLSNSGFVDIEDLPWDANIRARFLASKVIETGRRDSAGSFTDEEERFVSKWEGEAAHNPDLRESITAMCRKPL